MRSYSDDDGIEMPSDKENETPNRNDLSSKGDYYNTMTSAIESKMKIERNGSSPRNARRHNYDNVQSRSGERHRRSRSSERNNFRNEYNERQIEERPRSSERRNENIQHHARHHRDIEDENISRTPRRDDEERHRRSISSERDNSRTKRHRDIKEENIDGTPRRDDKDRRRKRSRSDGSSSDSANMDEFKSNELPMSLTWSSVEKVLKNGEIVYPSGTPRLSENYRVHLDKVEKEKAERQLIKNEGTPEPKPKGPFTLTLDFNLLKDSYVDVKDWIDPERFRRNSVQKYYTDEDGREHRITIAVEKWPEPDFNEIQGVQGLNTIKEKRRWHHRSRYEAVYVCDQAKLDEEIQRKRAGGPINSNMVALGRDRIGR